MSSTCRAIGGGAAGPIERKKIVSGVRFLPLRPAAQAPILTTPGVVCVVGLGRGQSAIPDEEIAAIETVLESGLPSEPWSYLPEGQRIRIEEGALAGLEGIVVKSRKPEWRLVVSVTLLQRSVAVEIDRGWAIAIK